MNQQQREVVQQALELLDKQWQCSEVWSLEESQEAAEALRQLLEQPVQEPCGWQFYQDGKWHNGMDSNDHRANTMAAGFPVRDVYPEAQPAPVQQKPLFADIIAQHPGLAEELKAMDAAPVQEPSLLATLKAVQGTLIAANEQGQIADTIWFSEYETLFDFIGAEIDKAEQATPPAQPDAWVGLADEERRKLFDPLHDAPFEFAKRIEAKLREKNGGAA